jgi:hypothetical protein
VIDEASERPVPSPMICPVLSLLWDSQFRDPVPLILQRHLPASWPSVTEDAVSCSRCRQASLDNERNSCARHRADDSHNARISTASAWMINHRQPRVCPGSVQLQAMEAGCNFEFSCTLRRTTQYLQSAVARNMPSLARKRQDDTAASSSAMM